jgi:hypothetical protein
MNQEIIERLYHQAADQCHTNEAWLFEKYFAEAVIKECLELWLDFPGAEHKKS